MTQAPDPNLIPATKLITIVESLERRSVPYAVGGAVALGYWSEARGTHDLDFNIFLPEQSADRVLELLGKLGINAPADSVATILREGQVRTLWDDVYVDLFFSYDPVHEECQRRAVRRVFGVPPMSVELWALCAEHCVFFKVVFNRKKDWIDIENVLRFCGRAFDFTYTVDWLQRALGPEDRAVTRFKDLWDEVASEWA